MTGLKLNTYYSDGGPNELPSHFRKAIFDLNMKRWKQERIDELKENEHTIRSCVFNIPYSESLVPSFYMKESKPEPCNLMGMDTDSFMMKNITHKDIHVTVTFVYKYTIVEIEHDGKHYTGLAAKSHVDSSNQITGICIAYSRAFDSLMEG